MGLKYYLRGLGLGIVVTAIIMGITSSRSRAMTDDEIIARAKQLGMTENRVLSETVPEDAGDGDSGSEGDAENSDGNAAGGDASSAQPVEMPPGDGTQPEGETQNTESQPESESQNTESRSETVSDSGQRAEPVSTNDTAAVPDDGETGRDMRMEAQTEQDAQTGRENAGTQKDTDGQGGSEQTGTPAVITVGSGDGSFTVSRKLEDAGAVSSASAFDTFLCENGYDKRIRAGNYTIPPEASDDQIARIITGQGTE